MMHKIENVTIGIVLGAVPIIACFLAGWWLSIPYVPESHVFVYALTGLIAGILSDVLFLRKWIRRAYSMNTGVWIAIYMFYSIGMFGFFMGVPVFNIVLAPPAGVFIGRRLALGPGDSMQVHAAAKRTAIFTTSVLAFVCVVSALLALTSSSTANDLQHMMGLPFQVTTVMIIGIIVGGGLLILVLDWWLTVESVKRSHGFFAAHFKSPGI